MTNNYAVEFVGMTKMFGDSVILNDLNFGIARGKITTILGFSGAGKTTLLDVLGGRKNSGTMEGSIALNGHPKNTKTFNFRRFEVPSSARPLHLKSTDDMNELVNLGIAPVNTTKYINGQLVELRKECLQLNKLLIQKYGHEF